MRAAERHYGAEAQCRKAREHARNRRDRARGRRGLSGAGQDQLPTAIRNCRIRCGICPDTALCIRLAVK